MAFVTKYKGLEVQCERIEDLDALADQLAKTCAAKPAKAKPPVPSETIKGTHLPIPATVKDLVAELNDNQRKLLEALLHAHPREMSDSDLRQLLNLSGNKNLAGVLAGISKAAKRIGLQAEIITTAASRNGKQRVYAYGLNLDAVVDLQGAFGLKGGLFGN